MPRAILLLSAALLLSGYARCQDDASWQRTQTPEGRIDGQAAERYRKSQAEKPPQPAPVAVSTAAAPRDWRFMAFMQSSNAPTPGSTMAWA